MAADVLWKAQNSDLEEQLGYGDGFSLAAAFGDGLFGMICGLSLELKLKACIVGLGKKSPEIHNLNRLAETAHFEFGTYADYARVITEYIYWYGKYPVPNEKQNNGSLWDIVYRLGLKSKPKVGSILERSIDVRREECEVNWENFRIVTKSLRLHYRAIRDKHMKDGGQLAF